MISLYERPRLGKPGGDRAGPGGQPWPEAGWPAGSWWPAAPAGATLTGLAAYDAAGHQLPAGSTSPGNG
jgi:hypothetical protein